MRRALCVLTRFHVCSMSAAAVAVTGPVAMREEFKTLETCLAARLRVFERHCDGYKTLISDPAATQCFASQLRGGYTPPDQSVKHCLSR